jgi:hypothetical protein
MVFVVKPSHFLVGKEQNNGGAGDCRWMDARGRGSRVEDKPRHSDTTFSSLSLKKLSRAAGREGKSLMQPGERSHSPSQTRVSSLRWYPRGHWHWKLPKVLAQSPPWHRPGSSWHSSMSVWNKEAGHGS